MNRFLTLSLLCYLSCLLQMQAQSVTTEVEETRLTPQGPVFAGHTYSPIAPLDLPLIRTTTQMNIGVGQTTGIRLPVINIADKVVLAPVGNLAVATGLLRHEQAIKSWMSVYMEFVGVGRLGTNVSSLLAQGVNTSMYYQLGWKIKVLETEKLYFSSGLELRDGVYSTIDLQRWAKGLIDSGYVSVNNPLIDTKPALAVTVPIRGMWTLSDVMGLYGGITVGFAESYVRGPEPRIQVGAHAILSTNWNPVLKVPIGTSIGFAYSELPESGQTGSGAVKNLYLRIGYTGERAFSLGVQTMLQYAPIADVTKDVTFITAGVDIRFYF